MAVGITLAEPDIDLVVNWLRQSVKQDNNSIPSTARINHIPDISKKVMNELTDHDWLQIEQAAAGCVSGTSDEWPDLRAAIERVRVRRERESSRFWLGLSGREGPLEESR